MKYATTYAEANVTSQFLIDGDGLRVSRDSLQN